MREKISWCKVGGAFEAIQSIPDSILLVKFHKMHGRLKVKTTAQQQEEKEKERAKKLVLYNTGMNTANEKFPFRLPNSHDQ